VAEARAGAFDCALVRNITDFVRRPLAQLLVVDARAVLVSLCGARGAGQGAQVQWRGPNGIEFAARATQSELRGGGGDLLPGLGDDDPGQRRLQESLSVLASVPLGERLTVAGEARSDEVNSSSDGKGDATLLGLRADYRIADGVNLYGTVQDVSDSSGTYRDNDLASVGTNIEVNGRWSLDFEASDGDRGNGVLAGARYRPSPDHELYTSYRQDVDGSRGERSVTTIGDRVSFGEQLSLFGESQFLEGEREAGLSNVFGLNFDPNENWRLGTTLQFSELERVDGIVERRAVSLSSAFRFTAVEGSSLLEWREDEGAVSTEQWLTANSIRLRPTGDLSYLGRFNFSETDSALDGRPLARFVEAGLGVAYRPVDDNRWNWLLGYTYLHDIDSQGQASSRFDQRSQLLSFEHLFALNRRWRVGNKLAWREGELRDRLGADAWFASEVWLATAQTRYHVVANWDLLAEYRWLEARDAEDVRRGILLEVSRHFGDNFKLGLGYNFTDFSDDLTRLDYDAEGWFINISGRY
jgi:hypothetical protein